MIHFNSPDHVEQRKNVEPLKLYQIEHAIDTLNEVCKIANVDGGNIALGMVQTLIWEYENMKHASMTAPKWISVDDSLPQPCEIVAVLENDLHDIAFLDNYNKWCVKSKYGSNKPFLVTHWMPLPTPPKV